VRDRTQTGNAAALLLVDEYSIKSNSFDIKGVQVKIKLDIKRTNTVSANLLGKIEGSDPKLKEEYVMIGAHLAHIGMNKQGYVFNAPLGFRNNLSRINYCRA